MPGSTQWAKSPVALLKMSTVTRKVQRPEGPSVLAVSGRVRYGLPAATEGPVCGPPRG